MINPDYLVPLRAVKRKTPTDRGSFLLMQVGEKHADILRVLKESDMRLARFYFCALFDNVDFGMPGSGVFYYTEDNIQIGKPQISLTGESVFPVSLEIRIEPKTLDRIREPFRTRIPPLAAYITMECRS